MYDGVLVNGEKEYDYRRLYTNSITKVPGQRIRFYLDVKKTVKHDASPYLVLVESGVTLRNAWDQDQHQHVQWQTLHMWKHRDGNWHVARIKDVSTKKGHSRSCLRCQSHTSIAAADCKRLTAHE